MISRSAEGRGDVALTPSLFSGGLPLAAKVARRTGYRFHREACPESFRSFTGAMLSRENKRDQRRCFIAGGVIDPPLKPGGRR